MQPIIERLIRKYPKPSGSSYLPHHAAAVMDHSGYRILADGHNDGREAWPGCGYCVHAEISAIENLRRDARTRKIDVLVIRFDRAGNLKNSRPCDHCLFYMAQKSSIL